MEESTHKRWNNRIVIFIPFFEDVFNFLTCMYITRMLDAKQMVNEKALCMNVNEIYGPFHESESAEQLLNELRQT